MNGSRVVWVVLDGKPGHDNQSLGLADALGRRAGCETHSLRLAAGCGLVGRLRRVLADAAQLPAPRLIIGAGHATHLPLLWLARRYAARSVVLMRPSLPLRWFDLCVAPEHDFPNNHPRGNLVLTRGALNRVVPGEGERNGRLILIGGPSKTHGWDPDALIRMLGEITTGGGWEIGDSRRTPEGFAARLREALPGCEVLSHTSTPADWVAGRLRQAAEAWVSEDSVSMIHEVLASGARVGLLPMPRRGAGRVVRGIDRLVADGYLTPFSVWAETRRLPPPPAPLREADRCAEAVLRMGG